MKNYIIVILISLALGALGGLSLYKRINTPKACTVAENINTTNETRTIVRYVDKAGQPVVKETIVSNKERKVSVRLLERPKNIIGIQGQVDGKGRLLVGPQYGRELFPNTYITGGILLTPKGKPEAVTAGLQLQF